MSEQATAEARREAERIESRAMDGKCLHRPGAWHMSDCAECIAEAIDRVAAAREREALERAAAMVATKYPTRPEIAEAIRALVLAELRAALAGGGRE